MGSPFNLHILWSTGQKTWEPATTIIQDAPSDVSACIASKRLESDPEWASFVETHSPPTDQDDDTIVDDTVDDEDDEVICDARFEPLTEAEAKQKAINAARRCHRLKGVNGETCCALIVDRKSGMMQVSMRRDKTPPIEFFKEWIAKCASSAPNRVVRFDQGGEHGPKRLEHCKPNLTQLPILQICSHSIAIQ
jgi:hypothetical protein